MKLKLEEVLDKVDEIRDADADYTKLANRWENIYFGKAFDQKTIDALREDDQEVVVTHDPYDAVNLAQRLVSGKPKIICPPKENTEESTTFANLRERWASAFWQQQARHRGKNLVDSGVWQSAVLARHAYDLRWVGDVLPGQLKKRQSPFLLRSLEPRNVGVARGELYTEYAYHKYRVKMWEAIQRWPDIAKKRNFVSNRRNDSREWRYDEVEIIDFWYMDTETGKIWNCVLLDDDIFVKEPAETKYPFIPIIMGFADTTEASNQALESLSLMYPLDGPWQAKCKQLSMQQTGALWYFWPFIYVTNEQGQIIPDFRPRPGGMEQLPPGSRIDVVQIQPNMPLAQSLMAQFEGAIQRSTFPTVMYGQAPGDIQSGFGVNMLADAARGRMRSIMQNLEATIEQLNSMMFAMVEVFGGKKGVPLWGLNNLGKPYTLTLSKEHIEDGYYENNVSLKAQLPENDIPRLTLGLQLNQAGLLSRRTFWELWSQMDMPEDEENRIYLEQAMNAPELQAKRHALALTAFYDKQKAQEYLRGTPLENVLNPPPPPQGAPGMHMMPDGTMMPDSAMGGPPMPPGMPPMMGGGMPPELGAPPSPAGGMMGTDVPMGPQGMMDLQGMMPPMPGGGGIPPEMVGGQITPEMLDMIRQADPLTFQAITSGGMTDGEIQQYLMGLGGGL